jgi:8-oxo-dGTP pyrophosphatase MutT (NUDIX family)
MTYELVGSMSRYEGKIFEVRTDEIVMPGGSTAHRDIVSKDNAVAIVAFSDEGNIALIHQYRAPMGEKLWELPAGLIDNPDEDALTTAQRELLEEVAYTAANWRELVTIAASPGFTDEKTTIYLAGDLTKEGRPDLGNDDEESDMELRWVPIDKAYSWVKRGKIINAHTVAGILAVMAYSHVD